MGSGRNDVKWKWREINAKTLRESRSARRDVS